MSVNKLHKNCLKKEKISLYIVCKGEGDSYLIIRNITV